MMRQLIMFVVLFGVSGAASAIVFGPTNLPLMGYPAHSCSLRLSPPRRPASFDSQWEVDNFNHEVERYNDQLREYRTCVRSYVEAATNDIKRIREKMEETINEANSSVR